MEFQETEDAILVPPTPMCDALKNAASDINEISHFFEWLEEEQGFELFDREIIEKAQRQTTHDIASAFSGKDVGDEIEVKLVPPIRKLLMQYYQIDENQLEDERRMLLDAQCRSNNTGKPLKFRVVENVNG